VLLGASLGALLAPLNSTMIAVALPEIRTDFDLTHGQLGWIISAYLITMAVAQPVGGRLGDQLGRRRVFRWAVSAFLLCSLLAALAPSFIALVAFRTGQAAAGAAAVPTGTAMLRNAVPSANLGRYLGINGAVMSVAASAGPLVGAGILELGSWRLLFLVNIPVIGAAALVSVLLPPDEERSSSLRDAVDPVGAGLFAGALLLVTALLSRLGSADLLNVGIALASVATIALLVLHQRGARVHVAAWALFRRRSFAAATSVVMLTNLVMYTTLLTVPFLIVEVRGGSTRQIGILLAAMTALMALLAPVAGTAADRYGRRAPVQLGAVLLTAAAAAIAVAVTVEAPLIVLGASLALLGLGVGLTGPALTAAVESAPIAEAGSAAGTNSMMRYIGSIIGAGLLAGLLDTGDGDVELRLFTILAVAVTAVSAIVLVASTMVHRTPPLDILFEETDNASPNVEAASAAGGGAGK
jgi:EmrB/QacA subfamily drug resistance transporter